MKNSNQINDWSSLFLSVDISGPVWGCVEYLAVFVYSGVICLQDTYWCYWALALVWKTVLVAMGPVLTAQSALLEITRWRVDSFHTESHVPIDTPLVHLFVSKGIIFNCRECPKHYFLPLTLAVLLASNVNVVQRVLAEIGRNQQGRFRNFLYFWRYYCLC